MKMQVFDPHQHAAEKAAKRKAIDDDLASGRVSFDEMRRRNSRFAHLDMSRAQLIIEDDDQPE